jgi:hypothetical protein
MKKYIFLILMSLLSESKAQWTTKTVDNGFDSAYRVAICHSTTGKEFLKMIKMSDGNVLLLIYTGYVCTESPSIEYTYKTVTGWELFTSTGVTSDDNKKVYLSANLESSIMLPYFKSTTTFKIRIDDDHCGKTIYEFNMTGSAKAFEFIETDVTPKDN